MSNVTSSKPVASSKVSAPAIENKQKFFYSSVPVKHFETKAQIKTVARAISEKLQNRGLSAQKIASATLSVQTRYADELRKKAVMEVRVFKITNTDDSKAVIKLRKKLSVKK